MALMYKPAQVVKMLLDKAERLANIETERNPEADAAEMRVTQDQAFEIADAAWERANEGKWDNYVPDEIEN